MGVGGQLVRLRANFPRARTSLRPWTEERRWRRENSAARLSPRRADVSSERTRSRDSATPPNLLWYTAKGGVF